MSLQHLIQCARGDEPADLLVTNARVINVFCGQIIDADFAVWRDRIVGFGRYRAKKTVDLKGRFAAPGLIDPHVHIESSMACPSEFVRAVLVHGTTTVVADPHEIANVLGIEGIQYMLASASGQPMNIFFSLPSCVPATDMETAGARLTAKELQPLMGHERILALAEMMNFPGVIAADPQVLDKLALARRHGKPIDGHGPGLGGKELNAYLAAGIGSDHECTHAREAAEKLQAGVHVMIRQGSTARNLQDLLPIVTPQCVHRLMWCTDDRHPHDLLDDGHIDAIVREAIGRGLDPVLAIRMATLNPAQYFGLHRLGALAPGRQADFVVFSDLAAPVVEEVYCRGIRVVSDAALCPDVQLPPSPAVRPSIQIQAEAVNFTVEAASDRMRVITIVPDQVVTGQQVQPASIVNGLAVAQPDRDLLKIAVVERHHATGNVGKGFVQGLGLKKGALASSVAHDSHNIIIAGTHDRDMQAALSAIIEMGGGLAVAAEGRLLASLALPIAGLMSAEPIHQIRSRMDALIGAAHRLGCRLQNPFMTLSFLALPVIPEMKITDRGLVDVKRFELVSLFV